MPDEKALALALLALAARTLADVRAAQSRDRAVALAAGR